MIALGLASFLTDFGAELIFPLIPVFLALLGGAPTYLGLVEGLANATASVLKLATGQLSDRFPAKKPLVLFGYGLATLSRPLVALATAPWHVLLVRVVDRIGKGVRTAPRDALLAAAVDPSQSGRAFGFHHAMDHAGAVAGPLVAAGLLALGCEMRTIFGLALVPGLLSMLAVVRLREQPMPVSSRALRSSESQRLDAPARLPGRLRSYFAILALFSLSNSSDAFLLLRATELGLSAASIPLVWAFFHVVKATSSYLGGGLADRVPRAQLIVCGWAVYALSYLGFGLASTAWHIWALFALYGTYYGLTEPAEKAMIRDLAPSSLRGRAYGQYHFTLGMTAIPAGLLTGWFWQTYSPFVALTLGAVASLLAAAALLAWTRAGVTGAAR
ncbi:MAG TPA: MFS transporter [Polyangiaceae bacterium]|nr:MFS transporter [Polyangiaceae bacterium]